MRDDGRRARIVAAVTDRDSTTGVAELMQRLCLFAVDQMALSGCALVLMSGDDAASVLASAGPLTRAPSPPCRWNWAKAPAWMPMPPGLRCCCRTCRPGTRTAAQAFAAAALAAGVHAEFSLPLSVGRRGIGTLDLCRDAGDAQ